MIVLWVAGSVILIFLREADGYAVILGWLLPSPPTSSTGTGVRLATRDLGQITATATRRGTSRRGRERVRRMGGGRVAETQQGRRI